VRADKQRPEQQEESVDRDAPGEHLPHGIAVVRRQREKDRRVPDGIHDRKQPGIDQQKRIGGGVHAQMVAHVAGVALVLHAA
jgi:hypothetical protein